MPRNFDHVYRVTELTDTTVPAEEIDALARELPLPLPVGYREYLEQLGYGELCDFLRVQLPRAVRASREPAENWQRETWIESVNNGWWQPGVLTANDLQHAVLFATSAEGDAYVSVSRFPTELIELPRHDKIIRCLPEGFFGAVADSTRLMEHDFPFFEPTGIGLRRTGGLGHQCYEFKPTNSVQQFINEARQRWSAGGFQQSRASLDDASVFIRLVQCRFVLYAGEAYTTSYALPRGTFSVVANHDRATTDEIKAFFEMFDAVLKFER